MLTVQLNWVCPLVQSTHLSSASLPCLKSSITAPIDQLELHIPLHKLDTALLHIKVLHKSTINHFVLALSLSNGFISFSFPFANCLSLLSVITLLVLAIAEVNNNVCVVSTLFAIDNNSTWSSPSGDFTFGFHWLPGEQDQFLLAIWFAKIPDETIVWFVKRDNQKLPDSLYSKLQVDWSCEGPTTVRIVKYQMGLC